MKRLCAFLFFFSALAHGQYYAATVTSAGTGYTSAPAVTVSNTTGCTAAPTFVAVLSGSTVSAVNPTFIGTGCPTGVTLGFSGGGGSGAAATAVYIPATIAVLSTVPVASAGNATPVIGGTVLLWQFACELTVPSARVQYYANPNSFRMPGTSQSTAFIAIQAAPTQAALTLGVLSEYIDFLYEDSATALAGVEAQMVTRCAADQSAMNNWNPWANYGSRYLNGTWTAVVGQ